MRTEERSRGRRRPQGRVRGEEEEEEQQRIATSSLSPLPHSSFSRPAFHLPQPAPFLRGIVQSHRESLRDPAEGSLTYLKVNLKLRTRREDGGSGGEESGTRRDRSD